MLETLQKTYSKDEVINATLEYFHGDELAADVWARKYCLKDDKNYFEKTPDDMHWRIARELARVESWFPNPMTEIEIYETLKNFKRIIPQGSPMSGIGNDFQVVSLSNCFVIGNEGEGDSYGGIMKLDQELVQLEKRRGGVGTDLSFVRPDGSPVKNSAITSTGVVPFMERYSRSTKEVAQDGRRGALMLSISSKHPDSEKFVDAKLTEGTVTGANISVKLDDEFMRSALKGEKYIQQFPINSDSPTFTKEIDPQKLWKKIIHNAWKSAEPGILFWDTIIRESVADCYADEGFKTTSTNPCFPASEHLLTEKGYISFGDGYKYAKPLRVITDNRISYIDDGDNENPENWKINTEEIGVSIRNASEVKLTQPMSDVIEIITKHGFTVKLTPDHHVATERGMVEAKDLQPDDNILISVPDTNGSIVGKLPETEEEISAYLIGLIVGDGTFDKSRKRIHIDFWGDDKERMKSIVTDLIDKLYEINSDILNDRNRKLSKYFIIESVENDKIRISSAWLSFYLDNKYGFNRKTKFNVPKFIYNNARLNIGKFYLSSLFYCDGSIGGSKRSGYTIRLSQSNKDFLTEIQRIAHANGIIMGLYKRRDKSRRKFPNGKGGMSFYNTKECYELITIGGSIVRYRETIGFNGDIIKEEKMLVEHNFRIKDSFYDNIVEVNECDPEPVYCIQEKETRSIIVNGISTRRCGEIPLCPDDSCRLLALNLFGYVKNAFYHGNDEVEDAYFDWELFEKDVQIAQRYMDDIIELEIEKIDAIIAKINSDPEDIKLKRVELELWERIKDKTIRGRRTGLGVTGEGDMLASLGFRYGTDEASEFSEKVHKTLKLNAYRSSVIMAQERGSFPIFNVKNELNNPFIQRIKEEDPELYFMMSQYGRRNISLLTIAPTGTSSIMTQTTAGVESAFLVFYMRRRKIGPQEKDIKADFIDDEGVSWKEYPVFHHNFELWLSVNGYDINEVKGMKKEDLNEIIKKSPYYKATSNDVDWVKKVEMQGRIQKHIDHSISVTVNLPKDATEEMVSKVYETGWKSGCKGITVYRDGSRSGVLVGVEEKKKEEYPTDIHVPKRPKRLKGDIHYFQNNLEKWIGVVGIRDGRPYEIFTGKFENGLSKLPTSLKECEVVKNAIEVEEINEFGEMVKVKKKSYDIEYVDKDGIKHTHTGLNHAFNPEFWNYAKLVSGVLRQRMPMVYVYDLVDSLNFTEDHINIWKNGVARVIKKYIKNGEEGKGVCPNCGSEHLHFVEGCLGCKSCGWTKCS